MNERFYLHTLLCSLCAVCAVLLMSGCRGNRHAAKAAEVRESTYYTDSIFADSKLQLNSARTGRQDTTRADASESGAILIQHNDNGQPERIAWTIVKSIQTVESGSTQTQRGVFGIEASRYTLLADSLDSISKEAEEITQTYSATISLKKIICTALLALAILCLIYVLISHKLLPWIKK